MACEACERRRQKLIELGERFNVFAADLIKRWRDQYNPTTEELRVLREASDRFWKEQDTK